MVFFFFFWCTRKIGRKTKPPNGIAFILSFTMRLSTFINKCIYNKKEKWKNTRTARQRRRRRQIWDRGKTQSFTLGLLCGENFVCFGASPWQGRTRSCGPRERSRAIVRQRKRRVFPFLVPWVFLYLYYFSRDFCKVYERLYRTKRLNLKRPNLLY